MTKKASDMRIAVTGGSGFIGQRLLEKLAEQGFKVNALENRTPLYTHENITPIKGGLTDTNALQKLVKGCDVVVHGAGLIAARRGADFYKVNTEGTRRLAQIASYEKNERFLLVSSLSAREFELSDYGMSKKKAEQSLSTFHNLKWDAIRPPAVYGPGDMQFLMLMKMVKSGTVLLPAGRDARASLVFVDDLVDAVISWIYNAKPNSNVYEIDDGMENGYLWQDVAAKAAEILNVSPRYLVPPKSLVQLLSYASFLAGEVTRTIPALPPEKARQLCHHNWVCNDHTLGEDINWKPQVSFDEGFKKTIAWYQAEGLLQ